MMDPSSGVSHPYWPRDLVIPKYAAIDIPMSEVRVIIFSVSAVFLPLSWLISGRRVSTGQLGTWRRLALCWFILCGFVHCFFEGWYMLFHDIIPEDQSFLSQLWKEYAKGDSRFMIADNFSVSLVTVITLLWGPLSFWVVFAFLTNKPYRFVLQLIVSVGQLNSAMLFLLTEHIHGFAHSDPNHFWVYFIGMRVPWIIFPLLFILDSWRKMSGTHTPVDNVKSKRN